MNKVPLRVKMSFTVLLRKILKSSSFLQIEITRQIRLVRVPTLPSIVMDIRPTRIYLSRKLIYSKDLDLAHIISAECCVLSLKRTPRLTLYKSEETRPTHDSGTLSPSSNKITTIHPMTNNKLYSQSSCVKH